jgi:hypothetical protein
MYKNVCSLVESEMLSLTLTRILHMEMKIYSKEAKKGQRVFKVNEFKHSDILK